jgi:hypothetical protein
MECLKLTRFKGTAGNIIMPTKTQDDVLNRSDIVPGRGDAHACIRLCAMCNIQNHANNSPDLHVSKHIPLDEALVRRVA